MVEISSFCGLRPAEQFSNQVPCPPYDVLSSAEARAYAKQNPLSFFHVSKAEIDLDGIQFNNDAVYSLAATNFQKMIATGVLVPDKEPSLYILQQCMGDHIQTGLMACVSVDDYDNGLIKKHEFTRKDKEDDRTRHIMAINAHDGQVFLTYRGNDDIDAAIRQKITARPLVDIDLDGVKQKLWLVQEREWIDNIINLFKDIPALYIADGHHRAAAASRIRRLRQAENPRHTGNEEYNRFMAVLFPTSQLRIMAYNRLILDTGALTPTEILNKLSEDFRLTETHESAPQHAHSLNMYMGGKWYNLTMREIASGLDNPVDALDVSLVQKLILNKIFHIEDPRTSKKLEFVGGIRGTDYLVKMVDNGHAKLALSLFPTDLNQLLQVADAGSVMPPKSTWFEPKLCSGMVIHQF